MEMVESITKPYRKYNEDGLIITNNLYVVIDGATTLFDDQSDDTSSVASELVRYLEKEIVKDFNVTNDFALTLNNVSKSSYKHFNFKTNVPAKLPSAGIAAVVESSDYYDIYLLGDLSVTYNGTTNKTVNLLDDRLSRLDNEVIKLFNSQSNSEAIRNKLIENRNSLGIKYQAFIPSLEPNFDVIHQRLNKNDTKQLLIASDGYYAALETFKIVSSYEELLNMVPQTLVNEIVITANTDEDLSIYPRLKKIDDISAIKITNSRWIK